MIRVDTVVSPLILATAGALFFGCDGRPRTDTESEPTTGPAVVELDLSKGVPEVPPPALFGPSEGLSFADLVESFRDFDVDDDDVKGLLVRFGGASVGFARAEETGRLLAEIRESGRPVFCHAHQYDNRSLMLAATGCTEIWLSPAGSVESIGVAAQLMFAKSLLSQFNVQADFVQVGKYKGAEETFTRDEPSAPARESLEGTLAGMRTAWIEHITAGRGRPALSELLEDGPYGPLESMQLGLIDGVAYIDEVEEMAKTKVGAVRIERGVFGSGDPPMSGGFVDAFRALSGAAEAGAPHVAVVPAVGAITMSASAGIFGGGGGITEKDLGRTLRELREEDATKAVVIRLDSPGGSALASDLLWRELMRLREVKPVVFSVGGMAASGGYYLACTANKIVAERTSIVGSIGVVAGKLAFGGALQDLGVNTEVVAATDDPARKNRAAYLSPFEPWDRDTRARVHAGVSSTYDLFLSRVAEGRGIPVEDVGRFAEGQIFAGDESKELGMVDELGGLTRAIELALELSELPSDAPVRIVGDSGGLFQLFGGQTSAEARSEDPAEARRALLEQAKRELNPLTPLVADVPLEVQGFLQAMSPLTSGESTLATTPYVVLIR